MNVSTELMEMCSDPFVLWSLCMLRKDDRFSVFVREPKALSAYISKEEIRINELKETSNKFDSQLVVQSRLVSTKWRKKNTLKGTTLSDKVENLSYLVAHDNIIWATMYNTVCAAKQVEVLLKRCYFTFSK